MSQAMDAHGLATEPPRAAVMELSRQDEWRVVREEKFFLWSSTRSRADAETP